MKSRRLWPELLILVLLIVCISFIIDYNHNSGRSDAALVINESGEPMIVHVQEVLDEYRENGHQIMMYKPDACKLIEVYDADMNNMYSLFIDGDELVHQYLDRNMALLELYKSKRSGSTEISIKDADYIVDFFWDKVGANKYLIVYVSSETGKKNSIFFDIVCYVTLVLALTLFTTNIYWNSKRVTRRYRQVHREVKSRILL